MKRKGVKRWLFLIVMLCIICVLPQISSKINHSMQAATNDFALGDQVFYGNTSFHVVDTDPDLKLISDTVSADTTWNTALTEGTDFHQGMGSIGSILVTSKVPESSDLSKVILNDSVQQIPTVSADWWLGDTSVQDASGNVLENRARFASDTNSLIADHTLKNTIITGTVCDVDDLIEVGVKPINNFTSEEVSKIVGAPQIDMTATMLATPGDVSLFMKSSSYPFMNNFTSKKKFDIRFIWNESDQGYHAWWSAYHIGAYGAFALGGLDPLTAEPGDSTTYELEKGVSYLDQFNTLGWEITYPLEPCIASSDAIVKFEVVSVSRTNPVSKTCPGTPNPAGAAGVRPLLEIPKDRIVFRNAAKRTYAVDPTLSQTAPVNDGVSYLTMLANHLTVSLTPSDAVDTSTNTITMVRPSSGTTISLPITLGGTPEGKAYVIAKAQSDTGTERYGVLGQLKADGTVDIDYSGLLQNPDTATEFHITLYQENEGSGQTAYIGEGTDITVKFIESQTIAFEDGQVTAAAYGTDFTLDAKLTSDLAKESPDDLTFSIVTDPGTAPKGQVITQNYDHTTGKATATIHPTTGTGSIKVAINKAGTSSAPAAKEVTMMISLSKKNAVIRPTKPTQLYAIGDSVPVFPSVSTDLVNADQIPAKLIAEFEPLDAGTQASPGTGTITDSGKWKLKYTSTILASLTSPQEQAFLDKYLITLKDYDDDPSLVMEVAKATLPAGWIVISPNANADGWNQTDLLIQPGPDAIADGYTVVELLDDHGAVIKTGATIDLTEETSSKFYKVRLVKAGVPTDPQSTREIKIDKTAPVITSSIERETEWTSKKAVTLDILETGSDIKSVTVTRGIDQISTTHTNHRYEFDADQDGSYQVEVEDFAGNTTKQTVQVSLIDPVQPTLKATIDDPTQPIITLERTVGASGGQSYKVFYKKAAADSYTDIGDLSDQNTVSYEAGKNGYYKFVFTNQVGISVEKEVTISMITMPTPVTRIDATTSVTNTPYSSNTWTNENVMLQLVNTNTDVKGPITWKVKEDQGSWVTLPDDTYEVTASTYITKKLAFKAVTAAGDEEVKEKEIIINIDQTLPQVPVVKQPDLYKQSIWYGASVKVEFQRLQPRPSGIPQDMYYKDGASGAWQKIQNEELLIQGNGSHVLSFKTIDAAGNESAVSDEIYVNINDGAPDITIRLNKNKVKDLLQTMTFGFFFQNTVDVDVEVDYGLGMSGTLYYIIDESATPVVPTDQDGRWIKGTPGSIDPDRKAMIYIKAESDAGVIGRESTINQVIADHTAPEITFPDTNGWTANTTLDVEIKDALAGIKQVTYTYQGQPDTSITFSNHQGQLQNLPDGTYDIKIKAQDHSGNIEESSTTVNIDSSVPILQAVIPDPDLPEIKVERTVGCSGVKTYEVYYKTNASDTYTLLSALPDQKEQLFTAGRNGFYKFALTNNAGVLAEQEVQIQTVGVPAPITEIEAKTVSNQPYTSQTWTNEDVVITLRNINHAVTDPVSWEIRENQGSWTPITGNSIQISTTTFVKKNLEIKGVTSFGEAERVVKTFDVNIDKTPPQVPEVLQKDQYDEDTWYQSGQTVHLDALVPKVSGCPHERYYKDGPQAPWQILNQASVPVQGNGRHELYFKTVDEAGNESSVTDAIFVNINDTKPLITIKLNQIDIDTLLQNTTAHFYYQTTVDVSLHADYGYGTEGTLYYILDSSSSPSEPLEGDSRWIEGDTLSLSPDQKQMLYVKAVSDAGTASISSSERLIIVDHTPPAMTLPDTSAWTKQPSLVFDVQDTLSGLKETAVKLPDGTVKTLTVQNDQAAIDQLSDGSYDLIVTATDYSGNEQKETITVHIDTTPPEIQGAEQGKTYYLPRVVKLKEDGSGIDEPATTYSQDGSTKPLKNEQKFTKAGSITLHVQDQAGNTQTIQFTIKPLPDVNDLTDTEKDKELVSEIEKEYEENKDHLSDEEQKEIEAWLDQAKDKTRTFVEKVEDPITSVTVEGKDDIKFDADTKLIVEVVTAKVDTTSLELHSVEGLSEDSEIKEVYDIYLELAGKRIQPNGTVSILMPYTEDFKAIEALKVVYIDDDQSIQVIPYEIIKRNGKAYISFETEHFSQFAIVGDAKDVLEKVEVNIDTDGDGLPDLNLDFDGDGIPECNIDTNFDDIPDIDIDSDGDGKPDVNIDTNGDGEADQNVMKITAWKPDHNYEYNGMRYDTMSLDDKKTPSQKDQTTTINQEANKTPSLQAGTSTGDGTDAIYHMLVAGCSFFLLMIVWRKSAKHQG